MATTADYRLGPHIFPRGWFMVAPSADLASVPLSCRFFARDLVLYRGESGRAYMVDAYCPHMGAHLGRNSTSYIVMDGERIEGENIRCPFHGWRFGSDGVCNQIPYSDQKPPKAARIHHWDVVERAGVIWAWHDAEGHPPQPDLLPGFEAWDHPHWVRWTVDDLGTLPQHPVEIVDNMTDFAHFSPIHGSRNIRYFYNEFDGPRQWQMFGAGHRTLVDTAEDLLELDTWYTGPAILQSRMRGSFPTHMLIAHTPVEDGLVQVWHALMVDMGRPAVDADIRAAHAYAQASADALRQDFEIWAHKRPCLHPLMVRGDGPTDKNRLWYSQFYRPLAEAADVHARLPRRVVTVDRDDEVGRRSAAA